MIEPVNIWLLSWFGAKLNFLPLIFFNLAQFIFKLALEQRQVYHSQAVQIVLVITISRSKETCCHFWLSCTVLIWMVLLQVIWTAILGNHVKLMMKLYKFMNTKIICLYFLSRNHTQEYSVSKRTLVFLFYIL